MSEPRIVVANGVALHVRDEGPVGAAALVFSNSLGTDLRVWEALLPILPASLRRLRYDTRGHGLSDDPPGPWRIADLADDLAGLLDDRGVGAAVVVGLSVGGLIAQSLALRRPDLVRGLVLMDTAARIGTAQLWNARIAAVETQGIAAISGPILERWFTAVFRATDPRLALWRHMLERTPATGYAKLCAAIRDEDLTDAVRSLRVPTLAMAGEEDGSTPPDLVAATAALIPGARFEVIEGAGHLPCVERPNETAACITRFLEDIGHAR